MLARVVLRKKGHIDTIIVKGKTNRLIDYLGYIKYSKYKMTVVYCINLEKFIYWYAKGINIRRSNVRVLKYSLYLLCLKKNIATEYSLLNKSYFRKKLETFNKKKC